MKIKTLGIENLNVPSPIAYSFGGAYPDNYNHNVVHVPLNVEKIKDKDVFEDVIATLTQKCDVKDSQGECGVTFVLKNNEVTDAYLYFAPNSIKSEFAEEIPVTLDQTELKHLLPLLQIFIER